MTASKQGREAGRKRRDRNLTVVQARRWKETAEIQIRFIDAALRQVDGIAAADDIVEVLHQKYNGNAPHVGAAIGALRTAGLVEFVGRRRSARPSRHANEIREWRIVDRGKATMKRDALKTMLATMPLALEQEIRPTADRESAAGLF